MCLPVTYLPPPSQPHHPPPPSLAVSYAGPLHCVHPPTTTPSPNPREGGVPGLSLRRKKTFVTLTETNVHGDALCFMVKTWTHTTTEALLNNGWWLAAVGGWWRLAVDGWQLVVVGGWWPLGVVLKGCP